MATEKKKITRVTKTAKADKSSKNVKYSKKAQYSVSEINRLVDNELAEYNNIIMEANNKIEQIVGLVGSIRLHPANKKGFERYDLKLNHLMKLKDILIPNLINNKFVFTDIDRTVIENEIRNKYK